MMKSLQRRLRVLVALLGGLLPLTVLGGEIILSEIHYHHPTNDVRKEFVEFFNRGTNTYNLRGWRISAGVDFEFPSILLAPGKYLVVAADRQTFLTEHPSVTNVIGDWTGRLSGHGETITLKNALGDTEDSVTYATEGDWADTVPGVNDHDHTGWAWQADHDGGGKTLELINSSLPNGNGQNWTSSIPDGGTPGGPNSVARTNIAPLILDVIHSPAVPRSSDRVTVGARVVDELPLGTSVRLVYRLDGTPQWLEIPMADDGNHGDGAAGDTTFAASIPPAPQDTVIEFYIRAEDPQGNVRTWPAPVHTTGAQIVNCLYQVDDTAYSGSLPLYRVTLTKAERAELDTIDAMLWHWSSNAEMNGTFISIENGETQVRYRTGFRLRGTTSRAQDSKSRHVHFRNDDRWRGLRSMNLNASNPHSQVLGSAIVRLAGLPAAQARAVEMRENNRQAAGTNGSPFGIYTDLEVLGSEFVARQFPNDSAGNLYHPYGNGNLDYLGEDPKAYGAPNFYTKRTNIADDDWGDIVRLTRTMAQTPDASYSQELRKVADVDEWVRYFALNTLLANEETGLGTGGLGDYALYCGQNDPRFKLLIYDLDSLLGIYGDAESNIWRATNNPAPARFLKCPDIAPLYYGELLRQAGSVFEPNRLGPVLDSLMGGIIPPETLAWMKRFTEIRRTYVLSQIPLRLTVNHNMSIFNGWPTTTNGSVRLYGTSHAVRTRRVLVNEKEATWIPWQAAWEAPAVPISPGSNGITVRALDEQGNTIESFSMIVWRQPDAVQVLQGTITTDQTLSASTRPWYVSGQVVVPTNVTLTIQPGTTLIFDETGRLLVKGRLIAEGTPESRIQLTRAPYLYHYWGGIGFSDAVSESRLSCLDMAFTARTAIGCTNSTVLLDRVRWWGTSGNILFIQNSSMRVQGCTFPTIAWDEQVEGIGLPPNGYLVFSNNVFGSTIGYQDIIDFTGGKRPNAIIQVLDNVFEGGSDDGLDLDGTDAHIEGNVFMHFHKNNDSTSESSAIATGAYYEATSDIVAVRNTFIDNDYDVVLKEGATINAANNTFLGAKFGVFAVTEPQRAYEPPPHAASVEDCVVANTSIVWAGLNPDWITQGIFTPLVTNCILPSPVVGDVGGNLYENVRLTSVTNATLLPGSPAIQSGAFGQDRGSLVPKAPWVSGEPSRVTGRTDATLAVGGPGIDRYRYRLDAGPWSEPKLLSENIILTNLAEGPHRVTLLGRNSAGAWQTENQATSSRSWTVDTHRLPVRINEILVRNRTAVLRNGSYPSLVELWNDSNRPVDLSGVQLSDDPLNPGKFQFPDFTTIQAGAFLILMADSKTNTPGFHLGFDLNPDGEQLYLIAGVADGEETLDSVTFGPQLTDYSIGRDPSGDWQLTTPTIGRSNQPARTGDLRKVLINEWLAAPTKEQGDDFVELYNEDFLPVGVGRCGISDEPVGDPTRSLLPPLSFIPGRSYMVFKADGQPAKGASHLSFKLSSAQGLIGLAAPDGTVIDRVAYGPQHTGVSMGRLSPGSADLARFELPTPGAGPSTVVVGGNLYLNELKAADDGPDWVELFNPSSTPVSLAGLGLTDRLSTPYRWTFPSDAVAPAGGYFVVALDSSLPSSSTNAGFGLSADGDALFLIDAAVRGSAVLDSVQFGLQPRHTSLGRFPDGTGVWQLTEPTKSSANQAQPLGDNLVVRINEWMAAPATGEDWLELYNPSRLPISLAGMSLTDNFATPALSVFPPLSFLGVADDAYVQLWADGKPSSGPAHLNFKLSSGGESIGLAAVNGSWVDQVVFGPQATGVSQGHLPDGYGPVILFPKSSSPGRANTLNALPKIVLVPDQTVLSGGVLSLTLAAVDADLPGQTLTWSLLSEPLSGLTLNAGTGKIDWSVPTGFPPGGYALKVRATDNGGPPLSDETTIQITVVSPVDHIVLASSSDPGTGGVLIQFQAVPGLGYHLEFMEDLSSGVWMDLGQVTATQVFMQVRLAPAGRMGFFRLRVNP